MVALDFTATKYHSDAMQRVFKTKPFCRWMKKSLLSNSALLKAVDEMEHGLIDADLGGNTLDEKVYKKRVPLPDRGKSGSTRTIVATSKVGKWFFLYGFGKNEKDNITNDELTSLRDIAGDWLAATDDALIKAVASGKIEEVCDEHE